MKEETKMQKKIILADEIESNNNASCKPTSFIFSIRFMTAIILFMGYCLLLMLRINMSIAIVCMVNDTVTDSSYENTNVNETLAAIEETKCYSPFTKNENSMENMGEFLWSRKIQGFILGAYYYGFISTQIIGGWLSLKLGSIPVITTSMLFSGLLTILIPLLSKFNWVALFVCRFFIGVLQGLFWPSTSALWSCWAPPAERTMLVGLSNSGSWVGTIVCFLLAGYLCENGFSNGWPSIFYIYGAASVIWSVLFYILCSNSPESHRFITEAEKRYITSVLNKTKRNELIKMPWKIILTSKACLVIYITHFCSHFCINLFLLQLPTFLKDIMNFDIKSNASISALPYIMSTVLHTSSSIISDRIIRSGKLSRTNTRKVFGAIGFLVPILSIIGLAFITCNDWFIAIILLVIGISFSSIPWGAGHLIAINDISGPYSGIVFGISNTIGNLSGIIVPFIVAEITSNSHTQVEWRQIFSITVGVGLFGSILWTFFSDSNLQKWAMNTSNKKEGISNPVLETRF